jgi:type IV secretion system protein VirB8
MTPPSDNPFQPNLSPPANGIAARAHYYEAASSWAQDTHAALRSSRRTAWIIAGVAIGVASLQAIAIAFAIETVSALHHHGGPGDRICTNNAGRQSWESV